MMKINPTQKKPKPNIEAGKKVIENALKYRYNFLVNKNLMIKYMSLCKQRGTNAPKELTAFIERQLKQYDEIVQD